ncbi:MAG: tetratricopeptide repeat protein [Rhodanobacteraceae bacterium]|nr:tetratricopeptide repeat protein [Rhodanobacteraceae bacterium]
MNTSNASSLFALARQQMQQGHIDGAIQSLIGVLSLEVQNAAAHALLALCLVDRKRLAAAEHEARAALAIEPQSALAHLALGKVHYARRRIQAAEASFREAAALDPQSDMPPHALGALYLNQRRMAPAGECINTAIELDPGDPSNFSLLALWHLRNNDPERAAAVAREVLGQSPDEHEALVVLGWAELRLGRVDAAYEHAVWAVRNAPAAEDALELLCAVKARRNPLLGLWFRVSAFIAGGSGTRTILLLVGMFLGVRLVSLLLGDLGYPSAAQFVSGAWLAFCVYSWVAPTIFQRMLRKELEQVRLRPDF